MILNRTQEEAVKNGSECIINGWGGRIRTHEWRDQNPLPYRLATPQSNRTNLETNCITRVSKAELFKDTTRTLLNVAVLIIFSFLLAAQAFANTNYSGQYQSEILISRPTASPVELARFYRDGIIYTNQGQVYFNKDRVDLLNSTEADLGLKINDIYIDAKDFYLATDMGIFQNYRRIFTKEACNQVIKTSNKIYAACLRGIYSADVDKKTLQTDFNWQLDEYSPQNANFITLNKSQTHVVYASADNGFYYYDSRKHKWFNRSYGLKRDFHDSFGFGRFWIDRDSSTIYLASSSGVYTSNNQGQTWLKSNAGLRSDPDGFFTVRQITMADGQLLLLSANGLYVSQVTKNLSWKLIDISNSKNDSDYNPSYYSVDTTKADGKEKLILSNSQGQIFSLGLTPVITGSVALDNTENGSLSAQDLGPSIPAPVNDLIFKVLKSEPKIQDLHKIALEFAGIPTGQKFSAYKRQARLRNIIPDFDASMTRANQDFLSLETNANDSFNSNTSSISSDYEKNNLNKNDNNINSGVKLSWKLSNLIYDPEINNINTSARITANVRENILTELTQIYYARKELLYRLLDQSSREELQEFFPEKLKLSEYTAQLDARTGAWFSAELKKGVIAMLNSEVDALEREKFLAVYSD